MGRQSPYVPSVIAATAPARLAEAFGVEACWRRSPSGGVEIITVAEGVFRRHIVEEDGRMRLADELPPTTLQRHGKRIALTGWLLCGGAMVGLGIASPDGNDLPPWSAVFFVLLVIGGFLFVRGGTLYGRCESADIRLKLLELPTAGWKVAPKLDGWAPASTSQLATVESLADRHGGMAFVREDARDQVEVLVRRRFRIVTYWVSPSGDTGISSEEPAGLHLLYWHARQRTAEGGEWMGIKTEPPPSD
jgi:hypothetical protein